MKKLFAMSLMLAAASVANAQDNYYTQKASDNIFIGGGVGIMSVINDGFNKVGPIVNLQVGKLITPVWAVRGVIGYGSQGLSEKTQAKLNPGSLKQFDNKGMFELNADAMVNLTNLFGIDTERKLDVYAFAGPTMNIATKGTKFTGESDAANNLIIADNDDTTVRVGATAGLGLAYNINPNWAVTLEGRFAATPSIFGDASPCRKAEANFRASLGVAYTFGGKNFKKVADRVIEKEVIREVPKEVIKEVIKEVKVEAPVANAGSAAAAVFFKINQTKISNEGLVNIKLIADAIKKSPANVKYMVTGSADKQTGSAARNQYLSEKRAQAVYDALIAEGVNKDQLEMKAAGGVDTMWLNSSELSRVTVVQVK